MFEFINDLIEQQESRRTVPKSKYRSQKVSFRQSLIELANAENAKVPAERRVSHKTILSVAERSLGSTANLKKDTRRFIAYKEAASFLSFAITGKTTNNSIEKYFDLLPVGHPLSTRAHRMSEAALNSANARWFAADPRIDDSVRELVASAYESPFGSIEYQHSVARISALTAGLVPREILLSIQPTALTAAGGNSSAARSARANMQRRDRKGQFAYQGGGFQFFLRGLGGKISSVSGRFVANSDKTDGFQIEVRNDKVLKDGLYDVPASKAEAIIAVLPDAPQNEEVNLPSGVEAANLAELKPLDAPAGWELVSTKKPGETGPDKVFKSGDGYIVEYYEPGNESRKSAAKSAWLDNQLAGPGAGGIKLINSKGQTGVINGKLQSDAPVYILKRDPEAGETKSRQSVVAITQSWADTQNEASNDEKRFDDDIKAKIDQQDTIAKNQKASLEKSQKAKAEQDKANRPIFKRNAEVAEDIQSNLDAGRDANGNDLPEGWTANKKEINPMQVDSMGNAVEIDSTKAADYSKENQGIKMSVSLNEDGSLNFNGQQFADWDAVADAEPDYVKGKIDENRNAVKEAIKAYDPDGKVADIIDAGGGPDEINAELEKNAAWNSWQEDLSTSWAVESPSAAQKASWAKLEKINKSIREISPPYNDERQATLPDEPDELEDFNKVARIVDSDELRVGDDVRIDGEGFRPVVKKEMDFGGGNVFIDYEDENGEVQQAVFRAGSPVEARVLADNWQSPFKKIDQEQLKKDLEAFMKKGEKKQPKKKGKFDESKLANIPGIQMFKVKGPDGNEIETPIIEVSGRPMVLIDIKGVRIPFYISTGSGGKANVPVGEWYPIFGMGADGWFNKGTEEDINDFYGVPELKEMADLLNSSIGDIRNKEIAASFESLRDGKNEDIRAQINADLTPGEYGQNAIVYGNKLLAIAKMNGDADLIPELEAQLAKDSAQGVNLRAQKEKIAQAEDAVAFANQVIRLAEDNNDLGKDLEQMLEEDAADAGVALMEQIFEAAGRRVDLADEIADSKSKKMSDEDFINAAVEGMKNNLSEIVDGAIEARQGLEDDETLEVNFDREAFVEAGAAEFRRLLEGEMRGDNTLGGEPGDGPGEPPTPPTGGGSKTPGSDFSDYVIDLASGNRSPANDLQEQLDEDAEKLAVDFIENIYEDASDEFDLAETIKDDKPEGMSDKEFIDGAAAQMRENLEAIVDRAIEDRNDFVESGDAEPVDFDKETFINIAIERYKELVQEELDNMGEDDDGDEEGPGVPPAPSVSPAPAADVNKGEPVVDKFMPSEGAWQLKSPENFEPRGRDDFDEDASSDVTDDPEVLANKFGEDALVDAFVEAIIGKKDYALDLLEDDDDDDEELDEDGEPVKKKGKPGPKKKKPEKKIVGLGNGALEFNKGDEYIPVEALYLALKNQGYDVDLLLAKLYDSGLGENKNEKLLKSLRKEENVQAETPLIDLIDYDDPEILARVNVDVALDDSMGAIMVELLEFNKNGEPNAKIVELSDAIRKASAGAPVNDTDMQIPEGLVGLIDNFIKGALDENATPDEKQAWQALWATIISLDEGASDGIEETRLALGVFDAIQKYNGTAEWSEVEEFFNKNGGVKELIKSKKAIVDRNESITDDDSFAGAYFRLVAESSRYNDVSLFRGVQVPTDSPLLEKLQVGKTVTFDARPFSTDQNFAFIFAGAVNSLTDKVAVVFTIKPLKGKSADLSKVSPFNELEHKVAGNFKVVAVKERKNTGGKTVFEVEVEMLSKRDAVLDGTDSEFNDLLMKENISPEMPEGYHQIDTEPYQSVDGEGYPANFEDKPNVIARNYSRDALVKVFRSGIEDGTGEATLEWDGTDVSVPVELIRDALQVHGLDTNSVLEDIANADPAAGELIDEEDSEAAEEDIDNPVNEIVDDIGSEYDMAGWKKTGPQLGSNEGGFYEDAEGNRYYVKKPKSDLHAQNEVLAAAFYRLLGIDAAQVNIGSGEDGVKMTFSPDITDSKQDLQEKLNDPEYLAKLQEGFAVDAWLGNWDVAGLVFDNVMSDGDGNPIRVDPGGALLFRAMGAPKGSLFGNEVNELDTLRDPDMNPQSFAVFGSMSEEQQKESARKLLDVTHDDIDAMVDGVITDENAAEELKTKLKARRQFILDRYDLLSEDTSVVVDNADISEEQDADPEAVSTPEGKSTEVDNRLDIARGWAEEYAEDEDILPSARKKFKAVADQIDKVLVDWRNGEISDEDLPGVLDELRELTDFGKVGDDVKLLNHIDDLDEQLMNLQEYIEEENKKNSPEPEVVEPEVVEPEVAEPTTSPATDKNGTPILPGAKLRYEKKGVVVEGVFSRYNKAPGYVWIKLSTGGKPVVYSTKHVTVIDEDGDGGGGGGPKAPEAPESPEPSAPETPTPDITPDEDIEPETETDIGQFDSTDAQLTKDGKVRVSFIVDGNRPFNPMGDGPAGYEEVLPYVVASKLDVDGVDEVTVEVPLDKMDDFVKTYQSLFREKLDPAEFFDDIYTDYQEMWQEDDAEPLPEPEAKTKEELPEFSREGWDKSVTPDDEVLGIKVDNSNRIIFDKKNKDGGSLRITVNRDTLEDPELREGLEDFFSAIEDLHKRYPIDGLVIGINNEDPDNPEVLGTTMSWKGDPPVITINRKVLTKKQRLSVEHVAAHEYGHALDPRNAEEAEKGLEDFKALMSPTFNKFPMTEYGLSSGREAFAEAFAAFYVRKYGKPFDANAPKTSYTQSQKVFQNDKFWENTIKHFKIDELATQFERSPFTVEDTFDADKPATLEEGEPKLNLYAQNIKDILKKQGTDISDKKAIEIRDAIEDSDLIDKWSSATEEDILAAIVDVVGPGIVDLVDENLDAVDADESTITTQKPFGDDSSLENLNKAADMLIKTFVHGMPFGGKVIAVNESSGSIAVTPDGKEVYLFDGKQNISFVSESTVEFFEPEGDGGTLFKWRPLSEEEDAAMTKKIADNAVPYGTPAPEEEDTDIDSPEEENTTTVTATEPPADAVTANDSTGKPIWAGVKVTDKKGASGTVIKVNKDGYAVVDFGDGALKWRSAKTLNSTGEADENFQGSTPKSKAAKTTKPTGAGAPPVIVDSPADWQVSNFAEVPSLPKAIEAALNMEDKSAAMRGASAAVDADSIEELDVRVMHVRTVDGQDSIQLKFKLTNWAGKKRIDEINKMNAAEQAAAGVSIEQLKIPRMEIGADGVGQMTSEYSYTNGAGRTYTITTQDGIVIRIHRANNENYTKVSNDAQARAFHNMVQIEAPVGTTDDQIANALAIAGVSEVRPATPDDARVLIENRLMSILDAKTDANTNPKGEKRTESLEKVKTRYGITVDDVIVTTGASGRIEYRLTPEGAEKIWKATGSPEVLNHDLRMPDIFDNTMTNEQRAETMTNWLVNLIASPQGGLLSTTTRWTEGIGGNGQSSWTDVGTGGADYVFTKPRRHADKKKYGTSSWLPTIYFDPKKAYERLDFYANEKDKFGKRQKSKDIISAAQVGAYEVMFKQRLAWDDLDVMVVSKEIHVGVIEGLKARGINNIGGRPIEEVIIVGGTP